MGQNNRIDFNKSLHKLDVGDLISKFDLSPKGMAKVEIDGKLKLVEIGSIQNLYKFFMVDGTKIVKAKSDKRALRAFKTRCKRSHGRIHSYQKVQIFIDNKWIDYELKL